MDYILIPEIFSIAMHILDGIKRNENSFVIYCPKHYSQRRVVLFSMRSNESAAADGSMAISMQSPIPHRYRTNELLHFIQNKAAAVHDLPAQRLNFQVKIIQARINIRTADFRFMAHFRL